MFFIFLTMIVILMLYFYWYSYHEIEYHIIVATILVIMVMLTGQSSRLLGDIFFPIIVAYGAILFPEYFDGHIPEKYIIFFGWLGLFSLLAICVGMLVYYYIFY